MAKTNTIFTDIVTAQDYHTFGMIMPGRQFSAGSYRFGYQGSEKDDEITGIAQSHFSTVFREGDTRLGRWWSVDPKAIIAPWESPYDLMNNSPIKLNDPLGDYVKYGSGNTSKAERNRIKFQVDYRRKVDEKFNSDFKEMKRDRNKVVTFMDLGTTEHDPKTGEKREVKATNVMEAVLTSGLNPKDKDFYMKWDISKSPLPSNIEYDYNSPNASDGNPVKFNDAIRQIGFWLLGHNDKFRIDVDLYRSPTSPNQLLVEQFRNPNRYINNNSQGDGAHTGPELDVIRKQMLLDAFKNDPFIKYSGGIKNIQVNTFTTLNPNMKDKAVFNSTTK